MTPADCTLMMQDGTSQYVYAYDGNGNISAIVNRASGATALEYEYSPFGDRLRADVKDITVADQPFGFATQYCDKETGFYCYLRRYYDPRTGRWLGRDPIGENGGMNLYGFCGNDPLDRWDVHGEDPSTDKGGYATGPSSTTYTAPNGDTYTTNADGSVTRQLSDGSTATFVKNDDGTITTTLTTATSVSTGVTTINDNGSLTLDSLSSSPNVSTFNFTYNTAVSTTLGQSITTNPVTFVSNSSSLLQSASAAPVNVGNGVFLTDFSATDSGTTSGVGSSTTLLTTNSSNNTTTSAVTTNATSGSPSSDPNGTSVTSTVGAATKVLETTDKVVGVLGLTQTTVDLSAQVAKSAKIGATVVEVSEPFIKTAGYVLGPATVILDFTLAHLHSTDMTYTHAGMNAGATAMSMEVGAYCPPAGVAIDLTYGILDLTYPGGAPAAAQVAAQNPVESLGIPLPGVVP
ncbi:MAG TPA: RHS repeat-associated core domain-containing protein [Opitutaceae bacterium]|nr:RHS repeat-associated core domain-containing protein [Opitutaceae bacterium]